MVLSVLKKHLNLKKISKIEKVEKLVANLHDKKEFVIHIRNLKQTLTHRLVFKKVHTFIKFNQKSWVKPYININTKVRKNVKHDLECSNEFFGKTMEHVRNIKLIKSKRC